MVLLTGTTTAVFLPTPRPQVNVYDDTGTVVSQTPLDSPPTLTGRAPAVTRAGEFITWWTGTAVMVFDTTVGWTLAGLPAVFLMRCMREGDTAAA